MNLVARFPVAARGIIVALILILTALSINGIINTSRGRTGVDLGIFMYSARLAIEKADPYAVEISAPSASFMGKQYWAPNLNPPIILVAFAPLAYLNYQEVLPYWRAGSLAFYLLVVGLLLGANREYNSLLRIAWIFAISPVWDSISNGQLYMPLLFVCVLGWLALQKHSIIAGICIGIVAAIKLHFLAWPILLLISGYRRTGIIALLTICLLSLIPIAVYGPAVYHQYVAMILSDLGPPISFTMNGSLIGLAARLSIPLAGAIISGSMLLAIAFWSWYKKPSALTASSFALVVSILASPFGWMTYDLFLLPVFLARRWDWPFLIAAAILAIPAVNIYTVSIQSPAHLIVIGGLVTAVPVLVLVGLLLHQPSTLPVIKPCGLP